MSWYVKATGAPSKVKASLESQFSSHGTCSEPEETARQSAKTAMLAIVGAYPESVSVLAHGQGSQSGAIGAAEVVGEFTVRVEALNTLL